MNSISQLAPSVCTTKSDYALDRKRLHSLPPKCPELLFNFKLVGEKTTGRNRALSDSSWTIHPSSALLVQPVPVETSANFELILYVDNDRVAFVSLNSRAGVLT